MPKIGPTELMIVLMMVIGLVGYLAYRFGTAILRYLDREE